MNKLGRFGWMLLTVWVFSSCKKDLRKPPPPPQEKFQLITTGELFNLANYDYLPCYWNGGELHLLDKDGEQQAFAYGLEKRAQDLYIAGAYSSDGESLMPCYWKNGQLYRLPVDELVIEQRCSARDLRWFNNALYILGDVDLQPVIWKIKNGITSIINIDGNAHSGGNLEIYDNRLYMAGNKAYRKDDGIAVYQTGYFTIDSEDKQEFHLLEDNLGFARCFGIAVSEKGIFITGELASSPARNDEIPAMWTENGRLQEINLLNRDRQRVGETVTDAAGNVYTAIIDIELYQPLFWKLPAGGGHTAVTPAVPAGARGFCNNLATLHNKLAFAFSYELQGKNYAYVGMDDKMILLQMDHAFQVSLSRTRIFED